MPPSVTRTKKERRLIGLYAKGQFYLPAEKTKPQIDFRLFLRYNRGVRNNNLFDDKREVNFMKKTTTTGILLAILAAALYAINSPFSKLLLDYMPSTLMAGISGIYSDNTRSIYCRCSTLMPRSPCSMGSVTAQEF